MADEQIGAGSIEYELIVLKGPDGKAETRMIIRADKVYMAKGGEIAFYEGNDLFFALAGGQWSQFRRKTPIDLTGSSKAKASQTSE